MHSQIPKYLHNRLQHLQNCDAGYVLGKYVNILDVIYLNWLPVAENTKFNISKLAYEGLHDKNWSEYLPIKFIGLRRNLRLGKSGPMIDYGEENIFLRLMKFLICYQLTFRTCEKNKSFINSVANKRF